MRPGRSRSWKTFARVASKLGRLIFVAFVLLALLVGVTTRRYASTHRGRRVPPTANAKKGDVQRRDDGTLLYFDGRQWTTTPPPAGDTPF